jgi:ParB family chromosome partitioning protein
VTRRGLGRGLDALISNTEPGVPELGTAGGQTYVAIDQMEPNPRQPRHRIDDNDLADLASSIRARGVIQPIVVTPGTQEGRWTIIAGERRWRAARLAGLREVPVVVRTATEEEMLVLAIVENVQRTDLNPIEAAEGYHRLMEGSGLTQAEVADLIGKSRVAVANTVRLLALPVDLQALVSDGSLSEGHARALLGLPFADGQRRLAAEAVEGGWPVRRLESEVRAALTASGRRPAAGRRRRDTDAPPAASSAEDADTAAAERTLEEWLGTRVEIRRKGQGGQIVVHFFSEEELAALFDRLTGRD